jgi:pyrroloquinoline quinone biosynthesis protein D
MTQMDDQSHPKLARGVRLRNDPISGEPVLLFPEGVLPVDETMHDILRRCNGDFTLASIIRELAEEYDVDPQTVRQDVSECLTQLREQMLIAFSK